MTGNLVGADTGVMKPYTVSVDIEAPRERVIELLDNPANLKHWQNGFMSIEHVRGEPGTVGSESVITYKIGKRTMKLTEVITKRALPDESNGRYTWGGGSNTLDNRFIELSPTRTRWESTCDYDMDGCMLKIMGTLFPGMFRKQNLKFMNNFKAFVEHGTSVADPS